MKKLGRFIMLLATMAFLACPFTVTAFAAQTSGNLTLVNSDFTITNGTLFYYKGSGGKVVIPDGVSKIADHAFDSCSSITEVILPEGVTSIGNFAFDSCYNLTQITIPSSVTTIGSSAFSFCGSLESITIPNGVTEIQDCTFWYCGNLENVTIPNTVKKIDSLAFNSCDKLTGINFPYGLLTIGNSSFWGCSLNNIVIPNSVVEIGNMAFGSCGDLNITIPESVQKIDDDAFFWTKPTISGYENTSAQSFATKKDYPFISLGKAPQNPSYPGSTGTKIIYNGKEYQGSVTFDTQSYNMAPKNIYDVGVKLAGNGNTKTIKVYSSRDGIASINRLPNGNYRITSLAAGTTYIICTIYNNSDYTQEITHASIKVTVTPGIKQHGVAARSTSYFN